MTEGAPPGHRAGRLTLLGVVLLALAGAAVLIVTSGAGGWAVDTGAAVMSWSWDFPWFL